MSMALDLHPAIDASITAQKCVLLLEVETDPDAAKRLRGMALANLDAVIAIATKAKEALR